MITCLADVVRPSTAKAVVDVLRHLGHSVDVPPAQTCCGQPLYNSGYRSLARRQAKHTIRAFEDADCIVIPSGSCAAMVKDEYPKLLADEPLWADRARELADRIHEFSSFLVHQLQTPDVGASFRGKVACHEGCHLRMLGQSGELAELVRHVQHATWVEMPHGERCCGFGGAFSVRFPHISTAMVDDKVDWIRRSGADMIVSTDLGCLMNIEGRLRRRNVRTAVCHIAELLCQREGTRV